MGWWWVLIVVAGLAGAGVVLGRIVWSLVRSGIGLVADLGAAAARLAELGAQVERLPALARAQPAVFDDPAVLRAERAARLRRRTAARRRARARARGAATGATGAASRRPSAG